ncbi:hypothetical protein [Cupriavidus sp. RAF12]|uniref:hypothetical protein n=1 Tax=Cupriavidus sp. RAF12 TaxID=3233050 RepID=UPI003F90C15E
MMSVPDKVNAAYPVASDVRIVRERLQALLADDKQASKALAAQIDARMGLRALNCSKNVQVGRFDSVASVRAKPLDITCFQGQDASLRAFYGMRTVGALLALPPLRPIKPLGQARIVTGGKLKYVESAALASQAGVGVMRDSSGEGVLVEVPGGQVIAALPRRSYGSDAVSPNGRVVVAVGQPQGLIFVDAETGSRIWELADAGRLVDWLAPLQAVLFTLRTGEMMLGDGVSGTIEAHPLAGRGAMGIALSDDSARVLIGHSTNWTLAEHTRTPEGIQAAAIRKVAIDRSSGAIPTPDAVVMRSGKLVVYPAMGDIGWLDLTTGNAGRWRTAPYFNSPFARLDDTHLLLMSTEASGRKLWSFDIDAQAVTPVEADLAFNYVRGIGSRNGFLVRGADTWIGDQVTPNGDAADLHKVVSDYALQQQLRKLQMMIDAEKAATYAPTGSSQYGGTGALRGSYGSGATATMPGLNGVPPNAQVHIVGVYEGKSGAAQLSGSHVKRDVRVTVRAGSGPIVLVLASYEPVNWVVDNAGARISAVLLSGYHPSSVTGTGAASLLRIGSAYAYSRSGPNYETLRNSVVQYTGPREIRSFQGEYSGVAFSVGES